MHHTPADLDIIERMAQEQFRYETIFMQNTEILRTDHPKYNEAVAQFQQSSQVVQPGQRWEVTEENVDEYLALYNDICSSVPRDLDDRIKIVHAAFAATTCLVKFKYSQLTESVQLAILARHNELQMARHHTRPIVDKPELPHSIIPTRPRSITTEDLRQFQSPDNLYRKRFILSPDTDKSGIYEVVGYSRKRDGAFQYEVVFDDCPEDPITADAEQMMGMLKDSIYLQA